MSIYLIILLVFLGINGFIIFFVVFNSTIGELIKIIVRNKKQTFLLLFLLFIVLIPMVDGYIKLYFIGYTITLIVPISVLFEFFNSSLYGRIKELETENERLKQEIEKTSKDVEFWKNKYYEE